MKISKSRASAKGKVGALVCGAAALAGCSSLQHLVGGEKVDYRNATPSRTESLEVPPDLTQLSKDSRYQQPGGTVNATTFQGSGPAGPAGLGSAPGATGATTGGMAGAPAGAGGAMPGATMTTSTVAATSADVTLERAGNERWVRTSLSADAVWPQLEGFWHDNGMTLEVDEPKAGVMETEWAENRAKLPDDLLRNVAGRILDPLYSTGERDKFRTRVERTGGNGNGPGTGTEIYISHRGLQEVYTTPDKAQVTWQPRPTDPELEAIMLQRLMVRLGASDAAAKTMVASSATAASQAGGTAATATAPARARIVTGQPAAMLQVDDGFDRAWRRVGLALDRGGFTVEDRDRTQGIYFVRYVDPKYAGRDEPNFFQRLFSFGKKNAGGPAKYRVTVKGEPAATSRDTDHSSVSVLDSAGAPENGDVGKRIVALLYDELK